MGGCAAWTARLPWKCVHGRPAPKNVWMEDRVSLQSRQVDQMVSPSVLSGVGNRKRNGGYAPSLWGRKITSYKQDLDLRTVKLFWV